MPYFIEASQNELSQRGIQFKVIRKVWQTGQLREKEHEGSRSYVRGTGFNK